MLRPYTSSSSMMTQEDIEWAIVSAEMLAESHTKKVKAAGYPFVCECGHEKLWHDHGVFTPCYKDLCLCDQYKEKTHEL